MHDEIYNSPTFRLIRQRRSFLDGMAALFDFRPVQFRYNYDKTSNDADANAIHSDWQAVGDDLRSAMTLYEKQH